jgi:hypothetical protein
MATRCELVALVLPANLAPEVLPVPVAALIAACWPGMSRMALILTAPTVHASTGPVERVAHVRRSPVAKRRRASA